MDKKLSSLFKNLSKQETNLLTKRYQNLSTNLKNEEKENIAQIINLKTGLNIETRKKSVNIRSIKARPFKAALIAAVVAALLAVSVGAAYTFIMPEGFFQNQTDIVFDSVYPVVDTEKVSKDEFKTVYKSVQSNGYTITFEAIAKGKTIRTVYEDPFSLIGKSPEEIEQAKHWKEITPDKTYAIFTLKADDGQPIFFNKINAAEIGYNVPVKGYDPSSCDFGDGPFIYEENAVLYFVCDITDAALFADKELHIAVFQSFCSDATIQRMDENGDPYFVESYDGFKAMFDLNLDKTNADSKKAKEYAEKYGFRTNPDYTWADEVIAKDKAFKQSGTDLSEFIGDNEWKGHYELQFGEVKMAKEYLELQKNRTEEMNILSCRKLYDILDKNVTDEFYAGLKNFDFDKDDAQIPTEWIPTNGYKAKLSDGSTVEYLGDQFFIHFENGGEVKLIMIPCNNIVFEFDMTVNSVNNIMIGFVEDKFTHAMNGTYEMGAYLDKEVTRPNLKKYISNSGETAEEIINRTAEFYKENNMTEQDAVFDMVNGYAYYNGIVQVIK